MTLKIDWEKMDGLVPAVIQHVHSGVVLMLGYMNRAALEATQTSGKVTFWSRSKQRLWTKGEESGHFLGVKSVAVDCDGDALLVLADPHGAVCHLGSATCWGASAPQAHSESIAFFGELETIVAKRLEERPAGSYTVELADKGVRRVAQKVGEEGVELALAAVTQSDQEILGEAADLVFHLILLLHVKGLSLAQVSLALAARNKKKK